MDTTAELLVIITSAILCVFLVALTVLIIMAIKLMNRIKRVSDKAEQVADAVESAAASFGRNAAPIAIIRLISNLISKTRNSK